MRRSLGTVLRKHSMNNMLQTIYQENISRPWEVMTDLDYDTQSNPASVIDRRSSATLNGNPKTLASSITYLPYGGITGLTYGNSLYCHWIGVGPD